MPTAIASDQVIMHMQLYRSKTLLLEKINIFLKNLTNLFIVVSMLAALTIMQIDHSKWSVKRLQQEPNFLSCT